MTTTALDTKYLGIYLNDHLAGSQLALELIDFAKGQHEGTELGTFLSDLGPQIEQDRQTLEEIMSALEVRENPVKQAMSWVAEKLQRLKPNGDLGDSPLTPMMQLETLSLGIEGKRSLWVALEDVAAHDPRLATVSFAELIARAEEQRAGVETRRREAARTAFSGG